MDVEGRSGTVNVNLENMVYGNKYCILLVPGESLISWFSPGKLMNFSHSKETENSLSCIQDHEAGLFLTHLNSALHVLKTMF
jgi:hypothetical protein